MSPPATVRNVLFGVLALQNDFVTRDQLIEAMRAWTLAKHRSLGDLLFERGLLGEQEKILLEALVVRQLARHGGDGEQSLQALTSVSSARAALAAVPDDDVQASLAQVGSDSRTATIVPGPAGDGVRYRVLRPHARGGLGEVFVAEDTELHREVALKEIQAEHAGNLHSRERFLLEAEVTGRLEHPGVVPVYSLGSYGDGRPYYVMRFIKGDNLKQAIERFHESKEGFGSIVFRRLLGRFVDVCNATAYAHSRGVLHRDLKPGNVMLGEFGETLIVDWGLAKVVGRAEPTDGEATLRPASGSGEAKTVAGAAVGTPAYMSPEQAEGKLDQLGPATDVYSLGATLYALLTGQAPVRGDTVPEVLEQVRRGDISPPRKVRADVPRALEAVCRKAIAVRPADRYPTALALAQDVERWLADDAVTAYREPLPARAGRWSRRHRPFVAAAAAVLVVGLVGLATGLVVVGGFNRRLDQANHDLTGSNAQLEAANGQLGTANTALQESNTKLDAARTEADAKRAAAVSDRAVANAVNDFLQYDLLQQTSGEAQANRQFKPEPDLKVRDLLDRAATGIEKRFQDRPLVEAAIRFTIGRTYHKVGEHDKALHHLQRALALREEHLPADDVRIQQVVSILFYAFVQAGKADEGLAVFERLLGRMKTELGPDHRETLNLTNILAWIYLNLDRNDKAVPMLEQAVALSEAKSGPNQPDTLALMISLGNMYVSTNRLDRAVAHLELTLERSKVQAGPDGYHALGAMRLLGRAYLALGNLEKALPTFEQVLEKSTAKFGPYHQETLDAMSGLAEAYQAAGNVEAAVKQWELLVERSKATYGFGHFLTLDALYHLSELRPAKAEPLSREALAAKRKLHGDGSRETAKALVSLGGCLLKQEKYAEAETLLRECVAIREKLDPNVWTYYNAQQMLGGALLGQKKYADAEPLLVAGYEGMKKREAKLPPGKVRLTDALQRLVQLYDAWGNKVKADEWRAKLKEAEEVKKKP